MNNNISNNNIMPYITYTDLDINKYTIYEENRNKTAIYRWNNLITGEAYVGSAVDLTKRLWCYFSLGFLKKELRRNRSIISSSLLKYGYSNFSLDVLEFCNKDILIEREQYYIDNLKPKYNILKVAGSRLGCKHSPETLLKYKNRKLSPKSLANLKRAKAGIAPTSPLRKINQLLATGHITTVINKETGSIRLYDSIRAAARDLGTNHNTLVNYIKTNRLYKGVYIITRNTKK
jgi:group I intron endonuclease